MASRCADCGIRYVYQPLDVRLYPSDPAKVCSSLEAIFAILLDQTSYPVLINCLKGQHYTGILVACIRRLQQWSMSSILLEFSHFEKKILVKLNADPARLPSWITVDQYEEVKVLLQ
ncbi:putative tyrosine-protein phosphatase [Blastocystis sp. subtype 4]|uniref:putative tyrosine-protein phosphatase n=1 Tax=Blastocystis sp. subtype 4 TaxID=944170 RepID=UPI000711C4F9|nr:putative tyrosine-protein phosphatase [Blastocystis sp. subtype 4]KNB44517.1 putative tyrosine-protein phosphatase [Blastocystis sp. subtype 4]|eukprot:XP_014527971.1 putative tyrosine-protein phosphatase [Blastocystis sp. subtype 4]